MIDDGSGTFDSVLVLPSNPNWLTFEISMPPFATKTVVLEVSFGRSIAATHPFAESHQSTETPQTP
jgi:hypothetical protein